MKYVFFIALFTSLAFARDCETDAGPTVPSVVTAVQRELVISPSTVFPTLNEAVAAQASIRQPLRSIPTGLTGLEQFPSFSRCERSFFRVATINATVDGIISRDGWKSGWVRRTEELAATGTPPGTESYDALPPTASMEDRIVQYVRVAGVPSEFPKNSSIVGVLENPIRALSVGYHTGMNAAVGGNHMRLDEIEVGPCAQAPECQRMAPVDSSAVFRARNLTPRYSTEGEWALDTHVPASCIVATYRINFQKVDDVCYSDTHGNCNF